MLNGMKTMSMAEMDKEKKDYEAFLQEKEDMLPSFVDTGLAAARTALTGGNTFLNMVENKRMMPANDGDDNFHTTQEFKDIVNVYAKDDISITDLEELKKAKNPEYLKLQIGNQQKYHDAIDTIEKAGLTGTAVETLLSFADLPSWVVGGAIFKAGKTAQTALAIQGRGARTLLDMGTGGLAASTAIYASEKAIQSEAGVSLDDRANTMAMYGAAVGMGLPLLASTLTTVASGAGRQSIANNLSTLIENIPGSGSMRGFFSLSTSDQLIHKSKGTLAKEIGNLATTRVTAAKDVNGNYITATDDTAMDYLETTIESSMTDLHYGAKANSDANGTDFVTQAFEDGKAWNEFTNSVEQTVRRDIGRMSKEEQIAMYKEATGVEEIAAEKFLRVNIEKADKIINDATDLANREKAVIETQVRSSIEAQSVPKREVYRKQQAADIKRTKASTEEAKARFDKVYSEAKEVGKELTTLSRKRKRTPKEERRLGALQKKKDLLDKQWSSSKAKWVKNKEAYDEAVARDINPTADDLALFESKARNTLQTSVNNVERRLAKAQKEADELRQQLPTKEMYPEDLFDVLQAHRRSKGFDDGIFVAPQHLKYIQDFYTRFGEDATKYGLKGIAGKDSRGYGHIKYNADEIMANVPLAEARFKEMLMDDELNKAMIRTGELTEEEVDAIAKKMVDNAQDRDFVHRYLDGGKGVQSTSATKHRKLRMNRALYPEYFVNDINVIGAEYSDRIAGKIALKKTYGMDTDNLGRMSTVIDDKVKEIINDELANGASQKAAKATGENARAVFETVLGSRKYNKDPDKAVNKVSRLLRKSSSALYNAGFVKYAIVEFTVAVLRNGLGNVINNFVPAFKQTMEQVKNASPNDPQVKLFRQAGLAIQIQRGIKYDRYDNMEITPTTGKTEMFLDKAAHWGRKYSGFNFVNDVSDFVAGGAALSELQKLMVRPDNLTKGEASRLARYGLSSEDVASLARQDVIKSADGQVTDWNYDNWRDQDLAKKFVRYLGRATRDTVMRADGTRVHRWQSDVNNPIAALGLQFTQMPTALYERILLNMPDEASARTVVGIITAVGTMYSILKLEDEALYQAGVNEERATDEALLIKAATRTPMAGIVPNFIDAGLMATGHSPLGSGYAPKEDIGSLFLGAGYSTGNKVLKLGLGLGDGLSGTDASNLLKVTPILNSLSLVNVGVKKLEKDLKDSDKASSNSGEVVPYQWNNPMSEYIKD